MRLAENWFELDLADEKINLDKWKYDVPPQECKITGIPRFGQVVENDEVIIRFRIDDCRIVNKATGETIDRLSGIESGE